ncbi:Hint domain-containing protein [Algirhabdus cladophorae]|uniref:Hint domain-containing protein n=1 Tax=Algirhabdus cladophorae TaxID=3377108 RepID=UPI003B846919
MSWIGLCDFEQPAFRVGGLHNPDRPPNATDSVLAKGTILAEVLLTPSTSDHVILDYKCSGDWPLRVNIQKATCGTFWMYIEQGRYNHLHALPTPLAHFAGTVQISYSWDGPSRLGHLGVYVPATGLVYQNHLDAPRPMPMGALADMTLTQSTRRHCDGLAFFAVSNQVEPLGVPLGLTSGTTVLCKKAPRTVGDLRPGMTVVCHGQPDQQVQWAGSRLRPARGAALPIRIRAPYLGLTQDLIVAADQKIALDGPDVEYLFSQESVLVRARDLIHGPMAMIEMRPKVMRYAHVFLTNQSMIRANGCLTESLHLTTSAQNGLKSQNTMSRLCNVEAHTTQSTPSLRGFEAMTLNRILAA